MLSSERAAHVELDAALAIQLWVAWAGEARSVPPRLGWWQTDLIDTDGGGDLLGRLLPRTAAWAALEAAREAARLVDAQARRATKRSALVTLFALGDAAEAQLDARLLTHKRSGRQPADALAFPSPIGASWPGAVAFSRAVASHGIAPYDALPAGRLLRGPMPSSLAERARSLASALVPLEARYVLAFYDVDLSLDAGLA